MPSVVSVKLAKPNVITNAEKNTIELLVGKEELIERKNKWSQPQYKFKSGTLLKYIRNVSIAANGCITDEDEEQ